LEIITLEIITLEIITLEIIASQYQAAFASVPMSLEVPSPFCSFYFYGVSCPLLA
jgi:hypothetical protein